MDDSNPLSCFTLNRTQRLYGFGIWYAPSPFLPLACLPVTLFHEWNLFLPLCSPSGTLEDVS